MKKIIFIITLLVFTFAACAQQVSKTNITIEKIAPVLYLNGTSASINFYNNDIILQQSSNLLTLSGGNFSLGSNSLLGTGSIGTTSSRLTKGWFTDLEITNLPTINGGTLSSALSLSSYLLKSDTASMLRNYALLSEVSGGSMVYPTGSGIPLVVSGTSWGTTITNNSTNWNTAYSWGDHSSAGYATPQDINDTMNVYLAGAEEVIAVKDSTGYAAGNYLPRYSAEQLITNMAGWGADIAKALRAFGGKIIAAPIFCDMDASTSLVLQDSDMFVVAIYLPRDTTLTGVRFSNAQNASYTADANNRIGLYKVSGTTATLVASTPNDADTWTGAQYAWVDKPFSSPYQATKGAYYIGLLYNSSAQTQAPSIYAGEAMTLMNQSSFMGNSVRLRGFITDKTDLPASFGMTSFSSNTASPMTLLY
jgi:hypothetical protein